MNSLGRWVLGGFVFVGGGVALLIATGDVLLRAAFAGAHLEETAILFVAVWAAFLLFLVESSEHLRSDLHVHECERHPDHRGEEVPTPYDRWCLCRCGFKWP